MKSKFFKMSFCFLPLIMSISSCSDFRKAVGKEKVIPDEFLVLTTPSLLVPPGYNIDPEVFKNKNVYITFDVDGFDASIMPATGTPEPGGLMWDETLNIIRIAAKNSNIVGADINELSPIKGFNSYNFLVAKLAYKILSYKFLY